MPKIHNAIAYKIDPKKISKKYTLNQLERLPPNSNILKNLYCPVKGCTAKLEFHHGSHTRHHIVSYLSTWPNSHHKPYCKLRLSYVEGRATSSHTTSYIGNNPEKLLRIAEYANKKMNNRGRLHKNNHRQQKNNSKSKNVSKHQNGKSKPGKSNPSSDPSSSRTRDSKRIVGNMKYYTPAGIKSSVVTGTVCLYGDLKDISLVNSRLILDINWNHTSVKIHSAHAFFNNQIDLRSDLQNINKLFNNKVIHRGKTIRFTGVVDIDITPAGKRVIIVNEPKFLRFPTKITLSMFIYNLNHEI